MPARSENAGLAPVGVFVGLTTLDVIQRVKTFPQRNEKVTSTRQDIAAGGPAANAAVTFAALGGRAILVSAVGKSPASELIESDLADNHVQLVDLAPESYVQTFAPPVSTVIVTESSGERAVASTDAAQTITAPADWTGILRGVEVALIDGHYADIAVAATDACLKRNIPIVLDAGRWKPVMSELLPKASAVICSDDFRVPGNEPNNHSLNAIGRYARADLAITHGAGAIEWQSSVTGPQDAGLLAVPRVNARDTLGAGDVFHGAFTYYTTQPSLDFRDQLDRAATIAAHRCATVGPRQWITQLDTVVNV